jgi:tetratricopeptide (TPR) repeat protein
MAAEQDEDVHGPEEHAQKAFALDRAGDEVSAVRHYEAALAGELSPRLRRECLLGLGSTLRSLGRHVEAYDVLTQGREEFPAAGEFPVFMAMAAYNLGRSHEAVTLLLQALVSSSVDSDIQNYAAAIQQYAADLDRTW